jgi:hypothetical protein
VALLLLFFDTRRSKSKLSICLSGNENIYCCRLDETRDNEDIHATNDDISFPDFGFSQPIWGGVVKGSPGAERRVPEKVSRETV